MKKTTFFFPNYGFWYSYDNPIEGFIRNEEGSLASQRAFIGSDVDENVHRQSGIWLCEYEFKKQQQLRAFVLGETYPLVLPDVDIMTGTLIKVRIGNFNHLNSFAVELTDKLQEMENHYVSRYPGDVFFSRLIKSL